MKIRDKYLDERTSNKDILNMIKDNDFSVMSNKLWGMIQNVEGLIRERERENPREGKYLRQVLGRFEQSYSSLIEAKKAWKNFVSGNF